MAFPKIICLKQMIILGVDLIDVGQAEKELAREMENSVDFNSLCLRVCEEERDGEIQRVRMVKNLILCQLDSTRR